MKWLSIAILVMAVIAIGPVKSANADAFSFSVGFHDELSPYGGWFNYSNYGNVWRPYNHTGFRPYVDGYWGYTNYGPTWYGNEPYASYVYHYGNWVFTPQYGWIWIPGNTWHAGNVNWSYGGGYIGWSPAYPSGYGGGYGGGYYGGYNNPNLWVVIDVNRFGYNSYQPYAYRSDFVRDLWDRRVFRQRYDTIQRADLERIVRRPVRTLDLRERDVRIGDRRAKLRVTPEQEVRIRKNVTEVRGRGNNRNVVERDTVMRKKFDEIRTKSTKKEVRSDDSRGRGITKREDSRGPVYTNKGKDNRSSKVATSKGKDSRSSSKVITNKGSDNRSTKKAVTSKKVEKVERKPSKESSKSSFSRSKSDRDKGFRSSSAKSYKKSDIDRGKSKSSTVRSTSRASKDRDVRSSSKASKDRDIRSSSRGRTDSVKKVSSSKSTRKAAVSKANRTTKGQKPSKRHN